MPRRGHLVGCLLALLPAALAGQGWQRGDSLPALQAAVAARSGRDAAVALAQWRATATGVVRFASVVEHGHGPIERVIRADELKVEVYGEAPNRSKQVIVAWRDTTFLPNDVRYHRDHLGIVANDFGPVIRLGQGDEVRDVPHPLSPAGLRHHEFLVGDTTTITRPDGVVRVVGYQVRPRDPASAGVVGTLYLDVVRATLVRFRFTFTAAAYRDPTVADITVVLESALLDGARWLPWRQSIVIRRETPWLDLPFGTVLRADWEIDDYVLGDPHPPARLAGPPIDGLLRPGGAFVWSAPLARRLAELPATSSDRDAVQALAARQLGGRGLSGLPGMRLAGRGVSDLVRATRVQGVTVGLGGRWRPGVWEVAARAAIGTSGGLVTGRLAADRPVGPIRLGVAAVREVEDVGDLRAASGVVTTLATLVAGRDFGDWALVEAVRLTARTGTAARRWDAELGWEDAGSLASRFTALDGTRRPNPPLGAPGAAVLRLRHRRSHPAWGGWAVTAEGGHNDAAWARIGVEGQGRIALGPGALAVRAHAGAGTAALPPHRGFVYGGRGTLPGAPLRALGGRRGAFGEVAWMLPVAVPTPPVPRLGRQPLPSEVGIFVAAAAVGGELGPARWQDAARGEVVAGLRLDLWGPLVRVDLGLSLSRGTLGVIVDLHPDWWPIL